MVAERIHVNFLLMIHFELFYTLHKSDISHYPQSIPHTTQPFQVIQWNYERPITLWKFNMDTTIDSFENVFPCKYGYLFRYCINVIVHMRLGSSVSLDWWFGCSLKTLYSDQRKPQILWSTWKPSEKKAKTTRWANMRIWDAMAVFVRTIPYAPVQKILIKSSSKSQVMYYKQIFCLNDITPANGKLVVWVGGLDCWDSLMKGSLTYGHPVESETTNPNLQFTTSWWHA